jgi:hypothetical protein
MNSNGIRAIGLRIVFFSAAMLLFSLLSALPALARETRVESATEVSAAVRKCTKSGGLKM